MPSASRRERGAPGAGCRRRRSMRPARPPTSSQSVDLGLTVERVTVAHVHLACRWVPASVCSTGCDVEDPDPRIRVHYHCGSGDDPRPHDCLGEAGDAVAAHLRRAAVGVAQLHGDVSSVITGSDSQQAVSADASSPVADRPGQGGVEGPFPGQVDHHQEVVAESVVLRQSHTGSLALRRAATTLISQARPPRSSRPLTTRGARREATPSASGRRPRPASGFWDRAGTTCAVVGRTAACG